MSGILPSYSQSTPSQDPSNTNTQKNPSPTEQSITIHDSIENSSDSALSYLNAFNTAKNDFKQAGFKVAIDTLEFLKQLIDTWPKDNPEKAAELRQMILNVLKMTEQLVEKNVQMIKEISIVQKNVQDAAQALKGSVDIFKKTTPPTSQSKAEFKKAVEEYAKNIENAHQPRNENKIELKIQVDRSV